MTTMNYPRVHQEQGLLKVELGLEPPGARRQAIRMVLDFGSSGEVLGIEIINLKLKAGKSALETISKVVPTTGEGVTYGYDEESDSFYLRLKSGNSLNQKSVDGSATYDEGGRITCLNAEWRPRGSSGNFKDPSSC